MNNDSAIHRLTVVALILGGLTIPACVPRIANLSKGDSVPEVVALHTPAESGILVLPLWSEGQGYRFRDPYIVPASSIGTPDADVPRRMGFYFDWFVCGGPNKYVVGYLVVTESGRFIWSRYGGDRISEFSSVLGRELAELLSGHAVGPALQELMQYGDVRVGVHASQEERTAALGFLERIPGW